MVASCSVPRCLTACRAHHRPLDLFSPVIPPHRHFGIPLLCPVHTPCPLTATLMGYSSFSNLRSHPGASKPLPFPTHLPCLSSYATATMARSSSFSLCSCRLPRDSTLLHAVLCSVQTTVQASPIFHPLNSLRSCPTSPRVWSSPSLPC